MFPSTLTANEKYPVRYCENLLSQIEMQLSLKRKTFCVFFVPLEILNIFKKKMIFIATLFRKLQTVKDLFRTLSKKHPLMTVNMLNGSQTLAKRAWEHIYHIFSSLRENLIWKTSPSVICEILGVFPNTLTANEKYPIWYCENLLSQMGMQLSL